MIICNCVNIKSRKSLIYFIKINDVHSFSGDLEKIFKINYFIENKIKFINLLKQYIFKIETFILFVNSNNFNDNSFDEERLKNFIEYVQRNPKDRMSDDYHLLRFGFINDNHRNKYGLSLDKFIRRYGKEIGELKHKEYSELQKKKSRYSVDYWMNKGHSEIDSYEILRKLQGSHTKKHLKDKSKEYIEKYHSINSPWRVEYYLNRGYNEIEAKEIISKLKKESSMFCSEYYQKLGYPLEESKNLSYEYWKDNCYKMTKNRIINGKEVDVNFHNRFDWIENLNLDSLNSDPIIIKKMKNIRQFYRKWKSRIITFLSIGIITFLFHILNINNIIKDSPIYIDIIFFLTIITFIGIFYPTTIREEIGIKDVNKYIEKKKKKDEDNKRIEDRATLK